MAVRCAEAGCGGTILEDGYCDTCGVRAEPQGSERAAAAPPVSSRTVSSRTVGSRTVSSRVLTRSTSIRTGRTRTGSGLLTNRVGEGLVEVPEILGLAVEAAVMADPEVPERERYCANPECGKAVGRSKQGRPGRVAGHCPNCGQYFSFEPLLEAGELVAGQYRILGPVGHGGRGWVYVGRDQQVANRPIVLKGILNAGDAQGASEAAAEMQYLAALEHPQIVKVYNFVSHESSAYIVMEYVEGTALDGLVKRQREAMPGAAADDASVSSAWTQQVLAYASGALEAMDYLHGRNITYNDMKPDNVMATGRTVKLIDLGAARRLDDTASGVLATPGFYAPELPTTGPSIASDIYTMGRTLLALLVPGIDLRSAYEHDVPDPDAAAVFARYESVYRLVLRATDRAPDARFATAAEMREQLIGVLREIVAMETGRSRPTASTLFTPDLGEGSEELDWRELPQPLAPPHEPAAGFLASLAGRDPGEAADLLSQAITSEEVTNTVESQLCLVRARLEASDFHSAEVVIDQLDEVSEGDWRIVWHRGLAALAAGHADDAAIAFDQVCLTFPGEPAAKLALAATAELAGDLPRAAGLYDIVSRVDPSFTVAAFGLARCLSGTETRATATEAFGRVPATSHVRLKARIAAARMRSGYVGYAHDGVGEDDLVAAAEIIAGLLVTADQRAALRRDVYLAALEGFSTGALTDRLQIKLFDKPCTVRQVRAGLERSYRELARYAETPAERNALVDLANRYRPVTVR